MAIPFDEKELEVVETLPEIPGFMMEFNQLNYPISGKQALYDTIINKKPHWVMSMHEFMEFIPTCVPDNVARAQIWEAQPFDPFTEAGGKDMFGVEWVFVPGAMGSMEREDVPHLMEDVNDWKECITFPDVDSWPWEEAAERNKEYLNHDKGIVTWMYTGWFERLISFMGFEEAAVALMDEDQEDAIKELMDAVTDVYCKIAENYVKYFDVDMFYIHDDWGTSLQPFFNKDVAAELFVPYMRKLTDKIHSMGRIAELHSCGRHGAVQIANIIAAGWDIWRGQALNDNDMLWEKYGDQICLSPVITVPEGATDEEKKQLARAFVDKYCNTPGKPVVTNYDTWKVMDDVIARELYIASREAYNKWPE